MLLDCGKTPAVRGLVALTVASSKSTWPKERMWKVRREVSVPGMLMSNHSPPLALTRNAGNLELYDSPVTTGTLSHILVILRDE